jgi:Zn-dependent protease with chaperone function
MNRPTAAIRFSIAAFVIIFAVAFMAAIPSPSLAISLQEEIDLGKKLNEEILKETPLSTDAEAQKEIQELGQRLVKAGISRPQIEYHFQILQDDDLNAFAIPGGFIYFSERLWNVLRRDERAGVLAHEIIHTDRRHALDAISKAQRRQIWLSVLLAAVRANDTWYDIADLVHSLYTLKYSREDERQADELGVELCHKAGMNPAGLLLAMRKIRRFQEERGGEPPKIFSSHPPTPERIRYLEELLTKMGVPIPPENVGNKPSPDKIGEVTAVRGNTVEFKSSKSLQAGDVVWLMGSGWDFYYENRAAKPIARGIVRKEAIRQSNDGTQSIYSADIWQMPGVEAKEITKGIGVHMPTAPKPETGVGRFIWRSITAENISSIQLSPDTKAFDRLFARQLVWNKDLTKLIYDNAGYVVLIGPPSEKRYVALDRPEYAYAPVAANSVLVRVDDPDQNRWVGTIVSIGRGGRTVELATYQSLEKLAHAQALGKRFDIVKPPWNTKEDYASRVVGKAAIKSLDNKLVLQMVSFNKGWSITNIKNGFDVYEEPK